MSPLNRSTDSIFSRQVVSSEPAATADAVTEGNAHHLLAAPPTRCGHPAAAPAAPGTAGPAPPTPSAPAAGTSFAAAGSRPDGRGRRPSAPSIVTSIAVERLQAPLAGDLEPADRLDLVAEELDPHRLVPVGGEDVDDPAAHGELAGQLHGRRVVEAVLDQPLRQLLRSAIASPTRSVRVWLAKRLAAGTGCNRLWMLVTTSFGRFARPAAASAAAAARRRPRRGPPARRERFRRRETARATSGVKKAKSSISSSTWSTCGTDDHQRGRGVGGQRGRHQRRHEPQTPSRVAAWPAFRLSTTSAKPSCRSRHPTSSSNRSDAVAAVSAFAII